MTPDQCYFHTAFTHSECGVLHEGEAAVHADTSVVNIAMLSDRHAFLPAE